MNILGISSYYHDSAAAIVNQGRLVAASQQERYSRKKYDSAYPAAAIESVLRQAGVSGDDLDAIAYYEQPSAKFSRVMTSMLLNAPHSRPTFLKNIGAWVRWRRVADRVLQKALESQLGVNLPQVICVDHHESHAASAYYPSPYDSAAVLCLDGVGEWATTTIWKANGPKIEPVMAINFPHSIGLLYSAFTHYCGFKVDSGEYKLMGLAPYGRPRYRDTIRKYLVHVKDDGSFRLNLKYFAFQGGQQMYRQSFEDLFGVTRRSPEDPVTQHHADVAASVQMVTEEIVLGAARTAKRLTGAHNLCLAGGVALNCVSNSRIVEEGLFKNYWTQPASGDAGGAVGCAYVVSVRRSKTKTKSSVGTDDMKGSYLGQEYSDACIQDAICMHSTTLMSQRFDSVDSLVTVVAGELAVGKVVAWYQGRSEFGPRALGNRSILADPRVPGMQQTLNEKIKYRESFRPFAPAILAEYTKEYFPDRGQNNAYMSFVEEIAPRATRSQELPGNPQEPLRRIDGTGAIPAVTHVDGTARVQSVTMDASPLFHQLITAFMDKTGCPTLVNTSFNVRGEPIVESPHDAIQCFLDTDIDLLAIGNHLVRKPQGYVRPARRQFNPD